MGVILVYSIDDKTSFDNVKGWMADIKREAHEKVSIVLLGNKCDLSEKIIKTEQGQALADEYGI
jgi:GTPase SAR1 family protein